MEVAYWFMAAVLAVVLAAWLQENTKIFTKTANLVYDLILSVYCRMMRHTGDPIYTYKARRYK